MRTIALAALVLALGLPGLARAQVQIHIDLPAVLPRMVVIQPGVQVVPQVDEEVFFSDGWYWCRRDAGWYRARDYRRGWVFVEPRYVPPAVYRLPPGQYRRWAPPPPRPAARYEERREDRREWREDRDDDRGHHDNGKHKGHGKHHDD
ncbi:MAG TPA: hypothetical protein VFP50_17780 [Anaeromyxobacteraceae bacterium]|nr:hypothetical protein [Anaeromyxobacteraceae bacterium]